MGREREGDSTPFFQGSDRQWWLRKIPEDRPDPSRRSRGRPWGWVASAGSASEAETCLCSRWASRPGRECRRERGAATQPRQGQKATGRGMWRGPAGGTGDRRGRAITNFNLTEVFKLCCCQTWCFPKAPEHSGMLLWGSRAPAVLRALSLSRGSPVESVSQGQRAPEGPSAHEMGGLSCGCREEGPRAGVPHPWAGAGTRNGAVGPPRPRGRGRHAGGVT